jgi:hypothetical protein
MSVKLLANSTPNIEGLLSHATKKRKQAKKKVEAAINKMIKEKERINFNAISQAAGVSKAFLYKDLEIRERIENLRLKQEGLQSVKNVKFNVSETSKDVIIEALKNKIAKLNQKIVFLEQEKEALRKQLKKDLGRVYENI